MVAPSAAGVGVAVLLVAATVALFCSIGTGFLPPADEGGFVIDYLTPAGSALEETDGRCGRWRRSIADTPEVAAYSRRTGSELGLFATAQNTGDILVRLKPRGERDAPPRRSSRTCGRSCRRRRRWPRSSSCSCCRTCSAISKATPRRSR